MLKRFRVNFINGPLRREHPLLAIPPLWKIIFWRKDSNGLSVKYRYYLIENQLPGLKEYKYTFIRPKDLVGDTILPIYEL